LFTVTSITAVKCILPLLFDSPSVLCVFMFLQTVIKNVGGGRRVVEQHN